MVVDVVTEQDEHTLALSKGHGRRPTPTHKLQLEVEAVGEFRQFRLDAVGQYDQKTIDTGARQCADAAFQRRETTEAAAADLDTIGCIGEDEQTASRA